MIFVFSFAYPCSSTVKCLSQLNICVVRFKWYHLSICFFINDTDHQTDSVATKKNIQLNIHVNIVTCNQELI